MCAVFFQYLDKPSLAYAGLWHADRHSSVGQDYQWLSTLFYPRWANCKFPMVNSSRSIPLSIAWPRFPVIRFVCGTVASRVPSECALPQSRILLASVPYDSGIANGAVQPAFTLITSWYKRSEHAMRVTCLTFLSTSKAK